MGTSAGLYYLPAKAATAAVMIPVGASLQAAQGVLTMRLHDKGDLTVTAVRESLEIAHQMNVPLMLSHHKLVGLNNHGRSEKTLTLVCGTARVQGVRIDGYSYAASGTMLLRARVKSSSDARFT